MDRGLEMRKMQPFVRDEGGFTTPAAALAILLACALVFACVRSITLESHASEIQYYADAGALAADNLVAEYVTAVQAVDAALLSLSLLALSTYAASAVAAFIPGGQAAAAELANVGSRILRARDSCADTASKNLETLQKALPALCALRSAEVIDANAENAGISYAGIAITSPMTGEALSMADDTEVEKAAEEIESKEDEIQKQSVRQQQAQERQDEAKREAWLADCGSAGMNMYQRAGSLSSITGAANQYYSSPETWEFSVPIDRARAYYRARYAAEPGTGASGSPEDIAESVARKRFYAHARDLVSRGYVETTASGTIVPHLVSIPYQSGWIEGTELYSEAVYPVSRNADARYIHAYAGCPTYCQGSPDGYAALASIASGSVSTCPSCKFSATTIERVPSISARAENGFEYHYLKVVAAAREYANAAQESEESSRTLNRERESIATILTEALKSISGKRLDPQPPGRYGCICIVVAPDTELQALPFLNAASSIPARVAISGATLAPDPDDETGNVIGGIAEGLVSNEPLAGGLVKTVFGAWGSFLQAYSNGVEGIEAGFKRILGAIPLVGTTLSEKAASAFRSALKAGNIEPADLRTYKPVLANTSYILERDEGTAQNIIGRLKSGAALYDALSIDDIDTVVEGLQSIPEVEALLDERGLVIASIPLSDLGLGSKDGKIYFPVPSSIAARIEDIRSLSVQAEGA